MGFDHKRVCRIVEKLGNDDKKVKQIAHHTLITNILLSIFSDC